MQLIVIRFFMSIDGRGQSHHHRDFETSRQCFFCKSTTKTTIPILKRMNGFEPEVSDPGPFQRMIDTLPPIDHYKHIL